MCQVLLCVQRDEARMAEREWRNKIWAARADHKVHRCDVCSGLNVALLPEIQFIPLIIFMVPAHGTYVRTTFSPYKHTYVLSMYVYILTYVWYIECAHMYIYVYVCICSIWYAPIALKLLLHLPATL